MKNQFWIFIIIFLAVFLFPLLWEGEGWGQNIAINSTGNPANTSAKSAGLFALQTA